ncbi:redox-active disulfide protein 2 [Fibrella aquatilis]|uniref:Redox-active disulfide protein 2 n=1 Tax=Fibrella aquatilis TaxID=2817059 RepID=A0A939GBR2_9BACT|nr:redox-active disulfide protein 2 [Fibrella aquatilis]MBO0933756.1 redox-active disulfide protein 2 [Fibrella aquatilis]
MNSKKLQDMSREELLKQQKSIKFVTGLFIGVLSVLLAITLYQTVTQGFTSLLTVPFALLPILLVNINTLRQIKQELANRKA